MRWNCAIPGGIAGVVLCMSAYGASASPVADAAMRDDAVAVRNLIHQKADVNAPQPDGSTAIQWAAYRNDVEIANLLIAAGADVRTPNKDGATPLFLAADEGSAPMIEALIKAGADPNEMDPSGVTPLMMASRSGNSAAIQVLLDHKANVNAREALRGTTPLMWAAEQAHPDAMKELIAAGADIQAASNPDTRNSRLNIAPTIQQRAKSAQGAGGSSAFASFRAQQSKARAGSRGGSGAVSADSFFDFFLRSQPKDGGGLTPLVYAARQGCLECAQTLVESGADVNQVTNYGWTPLLTATQNRHYILGKYLLDHGADPNIANKGGWTPLYLATDNRNIEAGDYPVRKPDMDHLDFIKLLIAHGANVNARVCGVKSTPKECQGDTTETRTNFTMQWLYEDGATPFLRAAQSGDVTLMKLLLDHGADPKIATAHNDTALAVASGIGWVEGVTFEWSPKESTEAVQMCLNLGIDPNIQDDQGRTALHGAAHKGRTDVIQLLVDHGANMEAHDFGSRDTVNGAMKGLTWIPLDWARGLVRVGVQSAIAHPQAADLLIKLMKEKGLPIPPPPKSSICLTKGVNGCA